MRPPWLRTAAVSALIGAAAAGCGDERESAGASGEPVTRLEVEVRPRGPEEPAARRTVVECSNGQREPAACQRLEGLPTGAFDPVPRGAVCTEIYGGPATAVVRGKLRGRSVASRFSRRNGCEIARWERFSWLLGDPPGARRP